MSPARARARALAGIFSPFGPILRPSGSPESAESSSGAVRRPRPRPPQLRLPTIQPPRRRRPHDRGGVQKSLA